MHASADCPSRQCFRSDPNDKGSYKELFQGKGTHNVRCRPCQREIRVPLGLPPVVAASDKNG